MFKSQDERITIWEKAWIYFGRQKNFDRWIKNSDARFLSLTDITPVIITNIGNASEYKKFCLK